MHCAWSFIFKSSKVLMNKQGSYHGTLKTLHQLLSPWSGFPCYNLAKHCTSYCPWSGFPCYNLTKHCTSYCPWSGFPCYNLPSGIYPQSFTWGLAHQHFGLSPWELSPVPSNWRGCPLCSNLTFWRRDSVSFKAHHGMLKLQH